APAARQCLRDLVRLMKANTKLFGLVKSRSLVDFAAYLPADEEVAVRRGVVVVVLVAPEDPFAIGHGEKPPNGPLPHRCESIACRLSVANHVAEIALPTRLGILKHVEP